MSTPSSGQFVEFGPYRVDGPNRLLWKGQEMVALGPKSIEVLLALIARAGQVVGKQELMDRVWPETFVEEANLSVQVSALRKALGEREEGGEYIQTIPKRGYRFMGSVQAAPKGPPKKR